MTEDKSEASPKSDVAKKEEEILKFWQDNKIFEKSLEKPSPNGNYVFYDGPPFATGLPHYGHILASTIKDAVPRYQTMNGKKVERKWGWDTHGLPIENIVEKQLNISGKKDIENMGVNKFNKEARSQVLGFVDAWKDTVSRMARWVDFDGAYMTMSNDYAESVWWALGEVNKKGLLYEGERVLPFCPRCETPIANSEIAMDNSYKDITDISVTVKFELVDEPGTFILAWTTTPWTLPGNVAAAVNKDLDYIELELEKDDNKVLENISEGDKIIIASGVDIESNIFGNRLNYFPDDLERADVQFNKNNKQGHLLFKNIKLRNDLVGKSYKPVFDYYKDVPMKNKENIWKVWDAEYVTTDQGTGIVHIAPVYGEEDMVLAKKLDLPLIHHVESNGIFKKEITDFAGMKIKPKEDHQSGDIEIIKNLAHRGKLFAKEKIIHSYPHCFRCETPLFYNAISAWFIDIQKVKSRALKLIEKENWIPSHLKNGRFKKSMEGAPDWNISRNRYWATPLPFWKSEKGDLIVVNSIEDLKKHTKSTNKYIVMRHAEAEHNVNNILSCDDSVPSKLTEKGIEDAKNKALKLKGENIDLIIASPLIRTVQTAKIIAEHVGIDEKDILIDDRLKETQAGVFNGKPIEEYRNFYKDNEEKFTKTSEGGENLTDMKNRLGDFIYDIDKKYEGKNILVVTHEYSIWLLQSAITGLDVKQSIALKADHEDFVLPGDFKEINFASIPHNENYELDMHRPYIDDIVFNKDGVRYKRIPEVVDCWLESGSMPFAQKHYPFENKDWFKENFPAQFVAEYIAQTRTWFYYTHMMSTILFDNIPFENIVTTGTVLAEDGEKMSKSKGNFPDPWILFNKFGVDSLRYYLLSSPLLKSEDLNFSEKGVDEAYKKIILRLNNVVTFYELYADDAVALSDQSENVLDKWMIARLNQLHAEVTESMESYELDKATRPFMDFIDDLSTWYLRRSRDRFKGEEKKEALETTRFVLHRLAILLAPFTPFIAEDVYKKVRGEKESVHLESWPKVKKEGRGLFGMFGKKENEVDPLIAQMQTLRDVVTRVLEARSKVGIRVRQPLQSLKIKGEYSSELLDLIKEEVNVKEIFSDKDLKEEIELDTEITSELKEEGYSREIIRFIQSLRKDAKLDPNYSVVLYVSANDYAKNIFDKFEEEIMETTRVSSIYYSNESGSELSIDELNVKMRIDRN